MGGVMLKWFQRGALPAVLVLCSATIPALPAKAQTVSWEVINRFRVFDGEKLHNKYISRLQCLARNRCNPPIRDSFSALIDPAEGHNEGKLGTALNFQTHWNESQEQYDIKWVHDPRRKIRVETHGVPRGSRCLWRQDGREIAGRYCSDREVAVPVGKMSIVTVEIRSGDRLVKTLETNIEPKDFFIAVVGDSYASGESNPHLKLIPKTGNDARQQVSYPAIWWDTRCHRSMVSGTVQSAALLAERHPHSSVTFVSYACSGAEIRDGVLTDFEGRETVNQIKDLWDDAGHNPPPPDYLALKDPTVPEQEVTQQKSFKSKLKPQIERLKAVLCPPESAWKPNENCDAGAKKRPDILIVSIGGNDIGFGEIGREILLSNPKGSSAEAREKWRKGSKAKLMPRFDELDRDYAKLAAAIRDRIDPKRTLLVEYIDPSQYRAESGHDEFCGKGNREYKRYGEGGAQYDARIKPKDRSSISFFKNNSLYNVLVTVDEAEYSQWIVRELNGRIKKAAGEKWNADGQVAEVFQLQDLKGPDGLPRGICASNSWFTGILESWNRQGWIPSDENHKYALKLNQGQCATPLEDGKCRVGAGNITSGVLHPNFFGHYNVGRVMLLKMEAVLAQ